jgi:pimeloyl-ACP methyl ester carboxylesterase
MPPAASSIARHTARVGDVTPAHLTAGSGDPLVLLHGFPQHSHMSRPLIAPLAERYTVIAPDLRGMGGLSVGPYACDKRTLAADVRALVQGVLGFGRVRLAGYDRGAGVAYANAAAHRDEVERVACSEFVFPGFGYEAFIAPKRGWDDNWQRVAFTVPELCDRFIAGRERELLSWYFHAHAARPGAVATEDPEHAAGGNHPQPRGGVRAAHNCRRCSGTVVPDSALERPVATWAGLHLSPGRAAWAGGAR